jgi:hypothetical protein
MSVCVAPAPALFPVTDLAAAVAAGNAGQLIRSSEGRVVVLAPLGREIGDATTIVDANPGAFYDHVGYVVPTIATVALTYENVEVQS